MVNQKDYPQENTLLKFQTFGFNFYLFQSGRSFFFSVAFASVFFLTLVDTVFF